MHLALALGFPHPDHLLANLTWRQRADWLALGRLEPLGPVRSDLQAAIVAATVANAAPVRKRHSFSPAEFMPFQRKAAGTDLGGRIRAFFAKQPRKPVTSDQR